MPMIFAGPLSGCIRRKVCDHDSETPLFSTWSPNLFPFKGSVGSFYFIVIFPSLLFLLRQFQTRLPAEVINPPLCLRTRTPAVPLPLPLRYLFRYGAILGAATVSEVSL